MAKILTRTQAPLLSFQQVGELSLLPEGTIRPVRWEEMDYALSLLLRASLTGPPPTAAHIEAFIQNARKNEQDLSFQIVGLWKHQLEHSCLCLPQAGGCAAIVTSPPCGYPDQNSPLYRLSAGTLRQSGQVVFRQGYSLLQMIVDVTDEARKQLAAAAGFVNLTDLIYMARLIHR